MLADFRINPAAAIPQPRWSLVSDRDPQCDRRTNSRGWQEAKRVAAREGPVPPSAIHR